MGTRHGVCPLICAAPTVAVADNVTCRFSDVALDRLRERLHQQKRQAERDPERDGGAAAQVEDFEALRNSLPVLPGFPNPTNLRNDAPRG